MTPDEGGLSKRGAHLLGFDRMCRCGHDEGLHSSLGQCAVFECQCTQFEAVEKETNE